MATHRLFNYNYKGILLNNMSMKLIKLTRSESTVKQN